jgi:hypothetical protein
LSERLAGISAELTDLPAMLERTERETELMETSATVVDQPAHRDDVEGRRSLAGLLSTHSPGAREPHPASERRPGAADL